MNRITPKMRKAMKRYYDNCKNQKNKKWDKQADLDNVFQSLPKSTTRCEATAGLFLVWWRNGIQTAHLSSNYWRGCIVTRKRKNGLWYQVRELTGEKIQPKLIR